jgi:hypothetical protein
MFMVCRYFVLARVPHATVLIYYGSKTMDEESILGYIDLRRVVNVKEVMKKVTLEGKGGTSFVGKFMGIVGGGANKAAGPDR